MTKKQICRSLAFVLVTCLVLVLLNDLFELENDTNYDKRFNTYRSMQEDSFDAVIVGTSGIDRYYIGSKGFQDYGISVYPLSTDAMPSWLYTSVIDYAYEKQDPELIIVDIRGFTQDNTDFVEVDSRGRRVVNAMEFFSPSRFKAAFKSMEVAHEMSEDVSRFDLSYLLSYIKFHDKWYEDDYSFEKNLGSEDHLYGGFYLNRKKSTKIKPKEPQYHDPEVFTELDPIAEESFYELLDYIEDKELNVLFLETPKFRDEIENGRANTIYKVLDERGLKYINYCETDEEGNFVNATCLDVATDFYNDSHVNYYGAEKFTNVFAEYLVENYDLPDRRDDKELEAFWSDAYDAIKDTIKIYEKRNKD